MSLEDLITDLTKAINRNTNTLLNLGATVTSPEPETTKPAAETVKAEPVKKSRAKPAAKPAPVLEETEDPNFVEEDEPTITKEELAAKITKAVSLNKAAVIDYMKPKGYTKVDLIPEKEYADVLDFLNKTIEAATKEDDGEDFSFGEE